MSIGDRRTSNVRRYTSNLKSRTVKSHCIVFEMADGEMSTSQSDTKDTLFTDYELLTDSDYLKSISPESTKLVEVVMIVDDVKRPRTVMCRNGKSANVLTFVTNNNDGESIQCNMWGSVIDQFIDKLAVNQVVHIDGAQPKEVDDRFNDGSVSYELLIQSNTKITNLGPIKNDYSGKDEDIQTVLLVDVRTTKSFIRVQGYLKTSFAVIENQQKKKDNTCVGSITHGGYYIEVRIGQFDSPFKCPFEKGTLLECVGIIQRNGNSFHLFVQSMNCIVGNDEEKVSLKTLLMSKPLALKDDEETPNKKQKI